MTRSLRPAMRSPSPSSATVTPSALVYATGGLALTEVTTSNSFSDPFTARGAARNSEVKVGWALGGGAEWMFMPNWSAKAEYLYTDVSGGGTNNNWANFGAWNSGIGINSVNNHTRWNTVRAGVNYHFNWGAAPVVAKY